MSFGRFQIHAGDFKPSKEHQFVNNIFVMKNDRLFGEKIHASEIERLEQATEESVKRLGGSVGWGAVGALVLGPIGLLAGLLAGGRGTDIGFVCVFKDGRRFMGIAPLKVYRQIVASQF